jgi:hypothetical protein
MLEWLKLTNLNHMRNVYLELAPRLNIFTGPNGSGKSFILDTIWWVLTSEWREHSIHPAKGVKATIEFKPAGREGSEMVFNESTRCWNRRSGSMHTSSTNDVVIYLSGDDLHFCSKAGLYPTHELERQNSLYNIGFNIARWRKDKPGLLDRFRKVLNSLSAPHLPVEIPEEDKNVYGLPVLLIGGVETPLMWASRSVLRSLMLAESLMTEWEAYSVSYDKNIRGFTILWDTPEIYLDPKWERVAVPGLLKAVRELSEESVGKFQIFVTTNSPLVMASLETTFNNNDEWFSISAQGEVKKSPFVPCGTIDNWLTSKAFGLKCSRSCEGEEAVCLALKLMDKPNPTSKEIEEVDSSLQQGLSEVDHFWSSWRFFRDQALADLGC